MITVAVAVLSRQTSIIPQWLNDLGIEVRKVDYESEDALVEAFKGVHTVLCALLVRDGTWAQTHIRLLNASLRAGVSRFVPAEWGPGRLAAHRMAMFAPQLTVREACRNAQQQHPSTFEFACFRLAGFMNYLGYGAPDEEAALHGLNDNWKECWWHVKEMKAEIPLTKEGKVPKCTLTEIRDVGRFAAAACLLPFESWREDFNMVGETLKMDEVARTVEEVRGRKVEAVYRDFETVMREKEEEGHFYKKFWYELEEMMAREEVGEGVLEPVLNQLCPNVKPTKVKEYVQKYWGTENWIVNLI